MRNPRPEKVSRPEKVGGREAETVSRQKRGRGRRQKNKLLENLLVPGSAWVTVKLLPLLKSGPLSGVWTRNFGEIMVRIVL